MKERPGVKATAILPGMAEWEEISQDLILPGLSHLAVVCA
jgi:hypothetical protein